MLYSSWWLFSLGQFLLITLLCTLIIKLFVVHPAAWVVFVYIGAFCLGAVSFAFLLSVFPNTVIRPPLDRTVASAGI